MHEWEALAKNYKNLPEVKSVDLVLETLTEEVIFTDIDLREQNTGESK
jgi:hypothetical protein